MPHGPDVWCHVEFAPAPDFARMETRLEVQGESLVVRAGRELIELECPGIAFGIERIGWSDVARARVRLDGPLRLVLRVGRGTGAPRPADAVASEWAAGLEGLHLPSRWTAEVKRSVLVLRGLVYRRTGALVAALTTSLPEAIGGDRNWDYRYCWLRDAALATDALVRLGSYREAEGYLRWLCDLVADGSPEDLRPLYGVEGETNLVEAELAHLMGYAATPPVRVGNSAVDQLQVDVFGTIVDLVHTYVHFGGPLEERVWQLVRRMVWAVAQRWREPDAGLWEHRHLSRHHVHAKVMCWVALDRALRLAEHAGRRVEADWEPLRSTIAADILAHGWSEDAQAFTVAYGSDDLDASSLHVLLMGLLPPDRSAGGGHGGGGAARAGDELDGVPLPLRRRLPGSRGWLPHLRLVAGGRPGAGGPPAGGGAALSPHCRRQGRHRPAVRGGGPVHGGRLGQRAPGVFPHRRDLERLDPDGLTAGAGG